MNEKKILSADQQQLVNQLIGQYGIEADDVLFFGASPEPFLTYEATCSVAHQLLDIHSIEIEQYPAQFAETIAAKCSLVFANGKAGKAVGIFNFKEEVNGETLGEVQGFALASARAVRNALRASGYDLIKIHRGQSVASANGESASGSPIKSLRHSLLGQAHKLGVEIGFIFHEDKTVWRRLLANRYQGIATSADLSEEQLTDLVAFLASLKPQRQAA